LAHFEQVPIVGTVTVTPASTEARDERRAGDRGVDDVVSTKFEVSVRFPPVENELGRRGSDEILD
jgi:hypothetical protein